MCLYASGMRRFHSRISARSVAARNSNNTRGPAFFCFHMDQSRFELRGQIENGDTKKGGLFRAIPNTDSRHFCFLEIAVDPEAVGIDDGDIACSSARIVADPHEAPNERTLIRRAATSLMCQQRNWFGRWHVQSTGPEDDLDIRKINVAALSAIAAPSRL
jgi:hypothetical protein